MSVAPLELNYSHLMGRLKMYKHLASESLAVISAPSSNRWRDIVFWNFVLVQIFASNLIFAQSELDEATNTLEEILVTAQKRETSLQDTPIAITVLTGDTLDAFNIQNTHDMIDHH